MSDYGTPHKVDCISQELVETDAAKDFRPCYVHVGTHKTGTTSIQTFLRDNRATFASHGVLVPRAGRSENDAGHHNLALQLLGLPEFVPHDGGVSELAQELQRSRARAACISSEHLSHLARAPHALIRLRDAIIQGGFRPIVVIYLRPQPAYFASLYAEIVKNGDPKSFASYEREVLDYGTFFTNEVPGPTFRYDALLDAFAAVFGHDAIVARRYRSKAKDGALLESIVALLIPEPIDMNDFRLPTVRENPTLTFSGVLKALDSQAGDQLVRELGADDMRFAPLGIRKTLRLAAAFSRSNIDLYRRYGLWLPPCEARDIFWALPVRKDIRRTRVLLAARRAIAKTHFH